MKTKICTKCGEERSVNEFYRDKTKKSNNGYDYRCKECVKKKSKKYYKENSEKEKIRVKKYYKENPEKKSEYRKIYREKNRDKLIVLKKNWVKENRSRVVEYERKNRHKYPKQKYSKELSDGYVRSIITQHNELKTKDIPKELIEAKRQHLIVLRKLKEN